MGEETGIPEARRTGTALQLLKGLHISLFTIFFLVSLILSVLMFVFAANTTGTARILWQGLAISLLAATVFSTLQILITNRVSERLVTETVYGAVQSAADRMLDVHREQQRLYVPLASYGEAMSFDGRFNHDLSEDLQGTDRYIFYGLTGRYVGPRLLSVTHRINDVQVIVGDPNSEQAIETRIQHEYAITDVAPGKEAVQRALVEAVDLCVMGLFLSRHAHAKIELVLTPRPNFDRVEICDSASYLTLFSTRQDNRAAFPQTLRWAPDSALYAMTLRDAQRAADFATCSLRIRGTTDERELLDFYNDELHRQISLKDLQAIEERFRQFKDDFLAKLAQLEQELTTS